MERLQRRECAGEPGRVTLELRGEMLHEVDLVDVAAGDRRAHRLDRRRVRLVRPGPCPVADAIDRGAVRGRPGSPDRDGAEREPAGLPRHGLAGPAQRARETVAEVDVRDDIVAAPEALLVERLLELRDRRELDHSGARAACRRKSTPSSRSETGTRSSAEWIRRAIRSGSMRAGKNP